MSASETAKRYWLFGGECYYAAGGWHDRRGMYDTIAEAVTEGKRQQIAEWCNGPFAVYEWWHVVDIATGEIVSLAKALKSMLDPEHDGTHAIRAAEFIVLNARVLEALTRPEIAGEDSGGEP